MQTNNRIISFRCNTLNFANNPQPPVCELSNEVKVFINSTSFQMNQILSTFLGNPHLLDKSIAEVAPLFTERLARIKYSIMNPHRPGLFDFLYIPKQERAFSAQDKSDFIRAGQKLYLKCMENYKSSPYITYDNKQYANDSVKPVKEFIREAFSVIIPESTLGTDRMNNMCDCVYNRFGDEFIKICLGAAAAQKVRESAHRNNHTDNSPVIRVDPKPSRESYSKLLVEEMAESARNARRRSSACRSCSAASEHLSKE